MSTITSSLYFDRLPFLRQSECIIELHLLLERLGIKGPHFRVVPSGITGMGPNIRYFWGPIELYAERRR